MVADVAQVEGEYLRARIKRAVSYDNLMINVITVCMKIIVGTHVGYALNSDTYFSTHDGSWIRYDDIRYGELAITGPNTGQAKTTMLNYIRDDVSEALTDYLKANME